jgi:hypothetical protein
VTIIDNDSEYELNWEYSANNHHYVA